MSWVGSIVIGLYFVVVVVVVVVVGEVIRLRVVVMVTIRMIDGTMMRDEARMKSSSKDRDRS